MAPPVFLPGEFHGQRSLVGYSSWGRKESDMTEQLTCSLFSRTEAIIALKPRAVPASVEIPNLPKEEVAKEERKGSGRMGLAGCHLGFSF